MDIDYSQYEYDPLVLGETVYDGKIYKYQYWED